MAAKKKSKSQKAGLKPASAFDDAALSKLTAKIETELSRPKPKETRHKDERPSKRKRAENDPKDANPHPKKRQAQEKIKGPGKPRKAPKDKRAEMLEEIKALGGDEADLDLVAGIDSDAEEGQDAKPTKSASTDMDNIFKNDLAKFAAGLGFENVRDEDGATDDEDDQAVGHGAVADEDWEDELDDGAGQEDRESDDEEEVPPAEKLHGRGKLVSMRQYHREPRPPLLLTILDQIFEPRPDWHALSQEKLPPPSPDDTRNFSTTINALKTYADSLLQVDAAAYESTVSASSTHKFMSTIMSSGTMSDKVSALTLAIQESPVHTIKPLENLMNLAGKKSREQAIAALGALVDLLGNGVVLPSDRRLRKFYAQPGLLGTLQKYSVTSWKPEKPLPGRLTRAHLIMWAYEDWLKGTYFKVIQLLELWSSDEIEYSRSRSLDFVFGLLRDKPEQEANLLRLLVNKLGDREKKIASRASYLLLQLLTTHPGMKTVVIDTIEQEVLLRPGQTLRTKYYAINTLNQTILSSKEPQLADTLVRIYFDLFVTLLKVGALDANGTYESDKSKHAKKKSNDHPKDAEAAKASAVPNTETAEKLVSAILTGVNRAVPFSDTDDETLEKHLDTLFRITHSSNFNTAIQALILVQQLTVTKHIAVDRYYMTLYESLLDPRLIRSSKQALYLNLLFRSLKNDVDVRRVKAFVKRMLQICFLHEASFVCGILFLVAHLQDMFPDLKTLLNEPEEDGDEEEIYRDAPADESEVRPSQRKNAYDGRKRDPRWSNAEHSCLWEALPYFGHFHPSVSVFASNLLVRQKALPKPELANHTLINFLDRFVYKNPKATDSKHGGSIMQPVLAAGSAAHVVVPGRATAKQQASVNSAAFWNKKQEDVAAENVFFHAYFSQIGKPAQEARAKKAKKEAVDGDEEEEIDEDEIWDALVNSRPEIDGDGDEDLDLDMSEDDEMDLGSLIDMSDDDDDDDDNDDEEGDDDDDVDIGDEDEAMGEASDLASDGEEEAEEPATKKDQGKLRKKQLKKLPMFATADDYAALLAGDDDE